MQILELLGSTASTSKVPQVDLTLKKDAFTKHLDDVLSHRNEIRSDDARRHASRQEERSELRPDREDRVDDVARKEKPDADLDEDVSASGSANKSADQTSATSEQSNNAAVAGADVQAALNNTPKAAAALVSENDVVAVVNDDIALGDGADDLLETAGTEQASGIVAALDVANKANSNAAFAGNENAQAANVASNNANPFATVAEQAARTVGPGKVASTGGAKEASELAGDIAIKADISDLSDDAQVTTQVAALNTPQQAKAPAAENVAKVKDTDDQVIAASPLIKDAKIAVGPDARLTEMKIAQALVEEAAADKIHAQFMIGAGTANNTTAFSQAVSAQASGALETAQPGLRQPAQTPAAGDAAALTSGQTAAGDNSGKATSQIAQPVPGANGLANMDANAQSSLSERAATTLSQLTAQAAQGNIAGKPSQAALPAAAMGAEISGNAMNNMSSSTPLTPLAEVGAPTAAQMANAAKPAAPPPPPTQQPPQAQVAMHIAKAMQNGTDKISIRLNPAELGRVDIKLEVARDGAVTASVIVDRPETLELLKGDARSLERALANAGLDPDSDKLSFSLRDQNSGNGTARNAEGDGRGSASGQDENSAEADDNVDVEALLAEARESASQDRALDINV